MGFAPGIQNGARFEKPGPNEIFNANTPLWLYDRFTELRLVTAWNRLYFNDCLSHVFGALGDLVIGPRLAGESKQINVQLQDVMLMESISFHNPCSIRNL
jgi:hypothetical protein